MIIEISQRAKEQFFCLRFTRDRYATCYTDTGRQWKRWHDIYSEEHVQFLWRAPEQYGTDMACANSASHQYCKTAGRAMPHLHSNPGTISTCVIIINWGSKRRCLKRHSLNCLVLEPQKLLCTSALMTWHNFPNRLNSKTVKHSASKTYVAWGHNSYVRNILLSSSHISKYITDTHITVSSN